MPGVLKQTIEITAVGAEIIRQRNDPRLEYDRWSVKLFEKNRKFVELKGWRYVPSPNKGKKMKQVAV
jgi:hypothetical protein